MAFNDNPKVDDGSKASEESVLEVKKIFTQRNGFITRDETPDFGVDLEVELIINGNKASGNKFSIQIKSRENLKIIDENNRQFISVEFLTSRLGYLCRKLPAYGLIIVYDGANNFLYFDYVENIVSNIMLEHGNEDWKNQKNVNIHIPISNALNESTINNIHNKFSNRFDSHRQLLSLHGKSFGIPIFSYQANQEKPFFNLDTPQNVVSFLEKYGSSLLDDNSFSYIYGLLSKLSFTEINNSPKLILLSAVTYTKIGLYLEADYFCKKSAQYKLAFTKREQDIINLESLRTQYFLGNLDRNKYLDALIALQNKVDNVSDNIFITIQIIHLKILGLMAEETPINTAFSELLSNIQSLFKKINSIEIEDQYKYLYQLSLSFYIFNIALSSFTHYVFILKMREQLGITTPVEQKMEHFNQVKPLFEESYKNISNTYKYAIENKNERLKAYALKNATNYFFMLDFNFVQIGPLPEDKEEIKTKYIENFHWAIDSFNIFTKFNLLHEAYITITIANELNELYKYKYKQKIPNVNEEELTKKINSLNKTIGIKEYKSIVQNFIDDTKIIKPMPDDLDEGWSQFDDNGIHKFALRTLETLGLPEDRLENIKNDIKSLKYFYTHRTCKNMKLLQDLRHTNSPDTHYKYPVEYVIRCDICCQQTKYSKDVFALLLLFDKTKCRK